MNSHAVKKGLIVVGLVVLCTALFPQFSAAAQMDGSKSIAKMLVGLEHFPSDADKAMLMEIANDSSNSEAIRKSPWCYTTSNTEPMKPIKKHSRRSSGMDRLQMRRER